MSSESEYRSFNALVKDFLGMRLPQHLADAVPLPDLPMETRAFILRMLSLMKRAGYPATGFTPPLTRWLSSSIPGILPGAWGGRIPPLTLPGRHIKLDDYVADQSRTEGNGAKVFLDIGCGFPPVTTADTARRFSDWQIYGVDRAFADYVLYDTDGHYACFDENMRFQYFQAFMAASGRALYADPKAAKYRFRQIFEDLFPLLKNQNSASSETVEKDGNKLVHHHIRDFEMDNLTFIKSDLDAVSLSAVKVARCMNVLIYFPVETRKKMLARIGDFLEDDGFLIAGTNGMGIQFRYAVYKKGTQGLIPEEFAFGLGNLGPIVFMPWFTIHDTDPESMLLTDLMATVRADETFWPDFSHRVDELLKQQGICRREPNGFFHFFRDDMPPAEYFEKNAAFWHQITADGYLDGAVAALGRAGYDAWKNPAGHIAIRPPANALPCP
jgi:hypothetical protein